MGKHRAQLCNSVPKSKGFCCELQCGFVGHLRPAQPFFSPPSESAEGSGATPSFRVGGPWQRCDQESKGCDDLAPKGITSAVQTLKPSFQSHRQVAKNEVQWNEPFQASSPLPPPPKGCARLQWWSARSWRYSCSRSCRSTGYKPFVSVCVCVYIYIYAGICHY